MVLKTDFFYIFSINLLNDVIIALNFKNMFEITLKVFASFIKKNYHGNSL